MIDIALLSKICEVPGAPGYEKRVRDLVLREIEGLADEVSIDAMGNVIAVKKGQSDKRVMVGAHMDEISFIVTHVDDEGFVRFIPLGGFDPKTLTSQRVIIHGKEDIIECVNSKSLDNRVSVYILIEVLKGLKGKTIPHDLYAVFTVQEEVGLRGAISAAGHIDPDFGFGLDVTIAFDVPGAQPHEHVTKLGGGAAIKVMDGMTISDYRMVDFLKECATRNKIPWQLEILPKGGTDTAGIQRSGPKGSIAGAISIPLRHIHQTIEMAHKKDVRDCIDLLQKAIEELDQKDWSF